MERRGMNPLQMIFVFGGKKMQLQEAIERLELNLSNIESENQVLRQQALVASTNEDLSEELTNLKSKVAELESENELLRNKAVVVVEQKTTSEIQEPPVKAFYMAVHIYENGHPKEEELHRFKEPVPVFSQLTKQRSLTDRQQENHDMLVKCLTEDKRFDKNKSVTACVVYKSLLQWRFFEAEKTNIFDRIIHTIRSSIESQDNIGEVAYWLSTTSTLLFLLQSTLKASNNPNPATHRSRTSPATLFGRMAKAWRITSDPTKSRNS